MPYIATSCMHSHWPSFIYTSTLAYIVDANTGRSSSAVAANSFFRGLTAFIATEVAVPLQVRAHIPTFHHATCSTPATDTRPSTELHRRRRTILAVGRAHGALRRAHPAGMVARRRMAREMGAEGEEQNMTPRARHIHASSSRPEWPINVPPFMTDRNIEMPRIDDRRQTTSIQ